MLEQKATYRQIFRATSIFGGVQVYNIIVGIIRAKIIAILLGPTGVGIISLFTSTIQLLNQATGFGVDQSGVRDIAEAYGTRDEKRISITFTVVRKIIWFTGLLGAIVCIIFAGSLSELTFGTSDYRWSFVVLSGVILLTQLGNGQSMLLRGTRRIKELAKSSMLGATLGLLVSIPFYYFYGIKGIVPSLFLSSVFICSIYWLYARKLKVLPSYLPLNQIFKQSKLMVKFGIMLVLSSLLGSLIMYIIRIFISNTGSVNEVGLFSACFMIIENYVRMVFAAMATDFYPRLSAINKWNDKLNEMTNYQIAIGISIIAPLIVIFIVFAPFLLVLLYSEEFVPITTMLQLAIVGVLFQVASWAMTFIMLAKADTKLYFVKESIAGIFMLLIYILGYYCYGLVGIGIAFILANIFHLCICFVFVHKSSKFYFDDKYFLMLSIYLLLIIGTLLSAFFLEGGRQVFIYTLCIICAFLKAFLDLDKRIGLREIFLHYWKNK